MLTIQVLSAEVDDKKLHEFVFADQAVHIQKEVEPNGTKWDVLMSDVGLLRCC